MADMGDMVEEVAVEQLPPPIFAANPVDDTEELLENEGAKLKLVSIDNHGGEGLRLDNIVEESSVEYKVETSVWEEDGVIAWKGATTSVEEKEMGEISGVEVIELEYDPAKEVIELDLGLFRAHNAQCPDCNHHITKIILRQTKPEAIVSRFGMPIILQTLRDLVSATIGVEGEIGESGMDVIELELEYDSSEEVIELELGSFRAHNPHCPNCNHRITMIILRNKNMMEVKIHPSGRATQHPASQSQIIGTVNRPYRFKTRDDKRLSSHDKDRDDKTVSNPSERKEKDLHLAQQNHELKK